MRKVSVVAILCLLLFAQTCLALDEDPYKVLGVSRKADKRAISKAFKRLSLKYHPDKNRDPSATDFYKRIVNAYELLSSPERRRLYDQTGSTSEQHQHGQSRQQQPYHRSGGGYQQHTYQDQYGRTYTYYSDNGQGGNGFDDFAREFQRQSGFQWGHGSRRPQSSFFGYSESELIDYAFNFACLIALCFFINHIINSLQGGAQPNVNAQVPRYQQRAR